MRPNLFLQALLLLLPCIFICASAQQSSKEHIQVSGTVIEKTSGLPAIGASVVISGSSGTGTVTDGQGTFMLGDVSPDAVLIFSSIGFKSIEVPVSGRTVIDVTLEEDNTVLEDVVVIGYGTAKSKDLTGSIANIKSDEILSVPVSSPMGALQGKVAGVQIVNSGEPGASPTVRVRGVGSFDSAYQGPLYVVDGMFFDNIDFLDNGDIESITVLKDASSAAIYGVRAANGVILVTTKKGVKGQAKINYNGYAGVQTPTHMVRMANSAQYTELMKEAGDLSNINASIQKWGGKDGVPTTNTDWYKELLNPGLIHSHSLNVSGSSTMSSYMIGGSYFDQEGIMKYHSHYRRYNILAKGAFNPFSWLSVGATFTVSNGLRNIGDVTAFRDAFLLPSIVPVYDESNTESFPKKYASPTDAAFTNGYYANPVARADYYDSKTSSLRFLPSVTVDVTLIPSKLKYHFGVSQEYHEYSTTTYKPVFNVWSQQTNSQSQLTKKRDSYNNSIIDNTLTYTDSFGKHNINVMAGHSSRWENYRMLQGEAKNIAGDGSNQYDYVSLGDADTRLASDDGFSYRGLSFFGRVHYDFDGKYLVSATIRRDGTSKYQEHWGTFPSIGLGWVISQEKFMSKQKVFDYLKIRGSFGILGNDKEPASDGFAGTDSEYYAAFGDKLYPGVALNNVFSWLKWEKVHEYNMGLTFSSFDGRLTGDIDYFNRTTTDAVVMNTVPITLETVLANSGSIRNEGVEISLGWSDKVGDFSYSVGLNATTLKNRVVSIQKGIDYILTGTAENRTIMAVGQAMNSFFGYKVIGIYKNEAEVKSDPIAVANGYKPGYLKYADMNNDGVLDDNDRTYLGSPYPTFTYGGNVSLAWKNMDFGLTFYGLTGAEVANSKSGFRNYASTMNFTEKYYNNHWTTSNTDSKNPSVEGLMKAANGKLNGYFVQKAGYFQVQNISLGYTFKKLFDRADARVYLSADRPFSFYSYEGFNPDITTGLDTTTYPMYSTYSIGVNITF